MAPASDADPTDRAGRGFRRRRVAIRSPSKTGGARPIANRHLFRPSSLPRGIAVLMLAAALLAIAGAIVDHWPFAIDRAIMSGVRATVTRGWLTSIAVQVTALGSVPVLTLVTVATAGLMLVAGRRLLALATIAGPASGGLAVLLLKTEVGRPRPTIVSHLVIAKGLSFPSGHAAGSAIVYLTLAALAAQVVRGRAIKRYLLATAIALVAMIGASRVYLGVHWPSDVLAGWCFGAMWAWGCWLATAGARARR